MNEKHDMTQFKFLKEEDEMMKANGDITQFLEIEPAKLKDFIKPSKFKDFGLKATDAYNRPLLNPLNIKKYDATQTQRGNCSSNTTCHPIPCPRGGKANTRASTPPTHD